MHHQKFSARKETEPPNPSHGKAGCAECKGGWARGSPPPGAPVQVTRTVRAAGTGAQRRRREPDPRTSGCPIPSRPSACPAAPPRVPSRLRERRRPLPGARPLESRLGSPRSARAGHPPGPRAGTPARRPSAPLTRGRRGLLPEGRCAARRRLLAPPRPAWPWPWPGLSPAHPRCASANPSRGWVPALGVAPTSLFPSVLWGNSHPSQGA